MIAAGLLINSFVRLTTVKKGYNASNVLALQLVFPGDYPTARKTQSIEAFLQRLRSHPHVQAAGFSRAGVFIGEEITYGTFVPRGKTVRRCESIQRDPGSARSLKVFFLRWAFPLSPAETSHRRTLKGLSRRRHNRRSRRTAVQRQKSDR